MLRLRLLGPVEFHDAHGADLSAVLAQPKRLSLLAYLVAASPRGFHRRDTLLALLWPELDDAHARKALNQALGFLRQQLESDGEIVLSRGAQSLGVDGSRCWCDAVALEEAAKTGQYAEVLALYRGDFLTGWFVDQAPGFEDWSDRERSRLRVLAADAAQALAAERRSAGDNAAAIRAAQRAVELSRSDERALRLLIELLDATGDRAGALAAYAEFEKQLSADLGVEPSPETRALADQVRARTSAMSSVPVTAMPPVKPSDTHVLASLAPGGGSVPPVKRLSNVSRRAQRWLIGTAGALMVMFLVTRGEWGGNTQASPPVARITGATTDGVAPPRPSEPAHAAVDTVASPAVGARGDVARLDPNLIAVLPFRVSDSDTSLAYLRDGMLDLLSASFTGVVHPVETRALLAAWRRAGAERIDADPQLVASLARQLGAGLILRGAVTGTGATLVLSASLSEVRDGSKLSVSVETPRDSLLDGVDHLVTKLLTVHAREDPRHVVTLGHVPLPMFREYLAGQALSRQGRFEDAIPHYRAAIGPDSDFALAGYALAIAAMATYGPSTTGLRVAMRGRDRLNDRDRAILDATIGPAYPATTSQSELFKFAEQATTLAPDRIEAWLALANNLFEGAVRDVPDWPHRAIAAYTRALRLDSTWIGPSFVRGELYFRVGDTARARTAMERLLRLDSTSILGSYSLWRAGVAFGQHDRRARGLDGLNRSGAYSTISNMKFFSFGTGLGFEDQEAPLIHLLAQAGTDRQRGAPLTGLYEIAALRGQPTHGAQFADTLSGSLALLQRVLFAATVDDGDSASAARFRDRFPSDMEERIGQCAPATVVAALYDFDVRHDSTLAAHITAMIREHDRSTMEADMYRKCTIGESTLSVLLATHGADGELRHRAESLDALLRTGPLVGGELLLNVGNVILARAWERLGEPRRALVTVRRRSAIYDPAQGFARMLRDEARLAAATGDVEGAIRAYRIFIALRREAEPPLQPQVAMARRELTRLLAMRANRTGKTE